MPLDHRPAQTPFVAGKPGGYAALLARRARLRVAAAVAVVAASVWWFSTHTATLAAGGPGAYVTAAVLFLAAAAGMFARAENGKAAAAAVGARSERRVAKTLMNLNPVALLHSVDFGAGGDADHLFLGPKLVAVETKTGRGKVSYKDGKLYVGSKALRGDPVAQCRRQALAAKREFSMFCDAVVCVVDMENAPFQVSSVTVCSMHDLAAVFAALENRLRPENAWARALELAPRCSTIHAKREAAPDTTTPRTPNQTKTSSRQQVSKAQPGATPTPNRKLTPRRTPPQTPH